MWTKPLNLVVATFLGAVALSAGPPAAAATPVVQATFLTLPTGAQGTASDVNAAGQVSGAIIAGGTTSAVRWDGTTRVVLPTGTHAGSSGTSRINASGAVAGDVSDTTQIATYARVWAADGTAHDCGSPVAFGLTIAGLNSRGQLAWRHRDPYGRVGSELCQADGTDQALPLTNAYALDEQGRVAGSQGVPPPGGSGPYHFVPAYVPAGGAAVTLPIPAGTDAEAYDFGPAGTIVGATGTVTYGGYYGLDINLVPQHAVAWIGGRMIQLGTLGGATSAPLSNGRGVNRLGDVVGNSLTSAGQTHAFRWRLGKMTDLGTLGGTTSAAIAVNDLGQVIGTSTTASGATHAFFWSGGRMIDLGAPGGATSSPAAINDNGQIVGTVVTAANTARPVKWTVR